MFDRFGAKIVGFIPGAGFPVQYRLFVGTQVDPQKIGEELVVTVPLPMVIESDQE